MTSITTKLEYFENWIFQYMKGSLIVSRGVCVYFSHYISGIL